MRVEMGYPEAQAERALLAAQDHRDLLAQPQPLIKPEQLLGAITWLLLRQDQVPQDPL